MRLVEALQARIAALEAQLGEPPKTSDNSSQPPFPIFGASNFLISY